MKILFQNKKQSNLCFLNNSLNYDIFSLNDIQNKISLVVNLFATKSKCTYINFMDNIKSYDDVVNNMLFIIYQQTSVCSNNKYYRSTNEKSKSYDPGYLGWISTLISIFIISIISIAMIFIVGIKKNIKVYRYMLEIFVASAVGALITDSLIHLYPLALGVHTHDSDHDHNHNIYDKDNYIWKGIILIATIYIFYLFEYLMLVVPKMFGVQSHGHHHHHSHHHDHFHSSNIHNEKQNAHIEEIEFLKQNQNIECNIICKVDDHIAQHRSHRGVPIDCLEHMQEVHQITKIESSDQITTLNNPNIIENTLKNDSVINEQSDVNVCNKSTHSFCSRLKHFFRMDKIVWMLTFGDALHNCIDGLVIGTQFMEQWPSGFSKGVMTSIAILCHEVPHEIGDYAAMLATGMSIKKCVLMNTLSTISCFIGGLIGCGIGSAVNTLWIQPIIAAIFIYIAMTVLMPNLLKTLENSKSPFKYFLCHTIGYFIGSASLIAIAFHEHSFEIDFHH